MSKITHICQADDKIVQRHHSGGYLYKSEKYQILPKLDLT